MPIRSLDSNYPYYRREYALAVQRQIDKVIASQKPFYATYLSLGGIKRATLYAQINQGERFLLEHLDKEGVYADLLRGPSRRIKFIYGPDAFMIDLLALPSALAPSEQEQRMAEMRKLTERTRKANPLWRLDFMEALEAINGGIDELVVTSYMDTEENREYVVSMCGDSVEYEVVASGLRMRKVKG